MGPCWKGGRRISSKDKFVQIWMPNHPNAGPEGYVFEHRMIASKILGRPLKRNETVHHVDKNRLNNLPNNLVICENSLHQVIHARLRALQSCGNAHWLRCAYCQKYGDPKTMHLRPGSTRSAYHNDCAAKNLKKNRHKKQNAAR